MPEHNVVTKGSSFKRFSFDHVPINNTASSLAFGNIPLSMLFEIDPQLYTHAGDISTNTSTVHSPALKDNAADILSPSWNQIDEWYNHTLQDQGIGQSYNMPQSLSTETAAMMSNLSVVPQTDLFLSREYQQMQTNAVSAHSTNLLKLHQYNQQHKFGEQSSIRQSQGSYIPKSHEYYKKMTGMQQADREHWPTQLKSSLIQLDHTMADRQLSLQPLDQVKSESFANISMLNTAMGTRCAPAVEQQHTDKGSGRYSLQEQNIFAMRSTGEAVAGLVNTTERKWTKSGRVVEKKPDTICAHCGINKTTLWRCLGPDEIVCNACGLYKKKHGVKRPNQFVERYGGVIRRRRRNQNDKNDVNKQKKAFVQHQPKQVEG
ncbi:hypothetical protein SARC_06691 [Sphaeroforma arctica JP610]|uniref:GATA-type domain-containing protein n=1 Tax=Sphaeroforma arctica JP610 TaxID=667725 RepID=A0A0L0FWD5_9EUKA|nr:hypothetical protein SARC_06691 [Sphaeroforma arctica JP610]KNC80959.1 hypothetical protein SARC_06691 [Sphaeroforma arctica JP610]|eukprot:XP_014154861.1 hypothetical protein SARC_06691 [Sphaeroforma arctica JP610]